MKIYRLQQLSSVYGLLEVDAMEIVDAYGYNAFEDLRKGTASITKKWPDCYGVFYDMSTTSSRVIEDEPDIYIWNNSFLMLSEKAKAKLEPTLKAFGEFLPITSAKKKPLYLFSCQSVINPNTEKSEIFYEGSAPAGIKSIAFDSSSVGTHTVFKTNFDCCTNLYCTETFKKEVEKYGFSGIIFNEDLSSKAGEFI